MLLRAASGSILWNELLTWTRIPKSYGFHLKAWGWDWGSSLGFFSLWAFEEFW